MLIVNLRAGREFRRLRRGMAIVHRAAAPLGSQKSHGCDGLTARPDSRTRPETYCALRWQDERRVAFASEGFAAPFAVERPPSALNCLPMTTS
jgi:hypothetical protein